MSRPMAEHVSPTLSSLAAILSRIEPGGTAELVTVTLAPKAQRRIHQDEESALELRATSGIPFWDAVFLSGEEGAAGLPLSLVKAALLHQSIEEEHSENVVIDSDLFERLFERVEAMPEGRDVLALSSRVTSASGLVRHLPMIDFASKSRRVGSEITVKRAIQALGVPGSLIESGRSYHYFGHRLLSADERADFLHRSMLLAPITDGRWIAHQLIEGRSALRISGDNRGGFPRLIAEVVS
jgi:hypothetical protein